VDLETLRRQAANAAGILGGDPEGSTPGLHEGLEGTGPVRLRPGADEPTVRHAGYLAGRLLVWIADRRPVDDALVLSASAYGAALATPEGQRMLPEPAGPREIGPGAPSALKAHLFAAALVEKREACPLDAGLERLMFDWLLEQTRTIATPALVGRMEELRARRLERLGLQDDGHLRAGS
jgi:hypothetical protein